MQWLRRWLLLGLMGAWFCGAASAVQARDATDIGADWRSDPEAREDLEALEELEAEMLEDLLLRPPDHADAQGPYEGMQPLTGRPRLRTVVDVPRAELRASAERSFAHDSEALLLDPPSARSAEEEVLRPVVERFDLSGIEPPFGLDSIDHEPIHHYLEFYTGSGRRRLARLLARSGRYAEYIRSQLRAAELPEELLYLVMIESAFDPTALSHAGAVGLWQFMPRTGRGYGLEVSRRYDERCDPELSTAAAIEYLGRLHDRFGSWPLAMAGYNAGGGHVSGQLRRYNMNDFWRMDDYGAVYSATRRYVYRIIAAAIIGENPERFGFEGVVPEDPVRWDVVEVPGRTRLSVLAQAAGTDVETLRELNPSLRVASTPDVDQYRLYIPDGSLAAFVANHDRYVAGEAGQAYLHRVRVGETLGTLAELFGLPERVLRASNGLERREQPAYGSEIVIPVAPADAADRLTREPGPAPDDEARQVVITPPLEFRYPHRQRVFYEVQPDDELAVVARAFGVSRWNLAMWNDVDPDAVLQRDMVLQVFVEPDADLSAVRYLPDGHVRAFALGSAEYEAWDEAVERQRRARRRTYTVRRGDTLGAIARRFGVSSRDLMRWNDLDNPNRIRIGQQLRVR